jgi:hypothetical protein
MSKSGIILVLQFWHIKLFAKQLGWGDRFSVAPTSKIYYLYDSISSQFEIYDCSISTYLLGGLWTKNS